ncbi:hypothetical protein D1AOALGA4SA_5978 [Olavius algarvensis Delta 1 endosymbiont]|nr:hypothetical protein D1AOALGA4SA_5978 [Olavius algarvensis Delta 1 endosymbiont]
MDPEEKCNQLAAEIRRILDDGITLGEDVIHYIDSTFSNPSIKELQAILQDDANCERDSLVELLFFPDETMQLELEELLENLQLDRHDEDKVLEALFREPMTVTMRLPEGAGSLSLPLPYEVAPGFIARLHISKHLDVELRETIDRYAAKNDGIGYKVKIRNSRFSPGRKNIRFLCDFFARLEPQSHDFNTCLDFALALLDELEKDRDLYPALMAKKRFYLRSLQKAKKLETQLEKSNLETMLSQGKRVILVDQADARKSMLIIDRISRAVFGKTEYIEDLHPDGGNIELRSDQDIQDIIKSLS